jgi:hypothetical protein
MCGKDSRSGRCRHCALAEGLRMDFRARPSTHTVLVDVDGPSWWVGKPPNDFTRLAAAMIAPLADKATLYKWRDNNYD